MVDWSTTSAHMDIASVMIWSRMEDLTAVVSTIMNNKIGSVIVTGKVCAVYMCTRESLNAFG